MGDEDKKPPADDGGDGSGGVSIWDTIDNVAEHPCVVVAVKGFMAKLDLCVSKSYVIVDNEDETDHKAALLRLPGKFYIMPTDGYAVSIGEDDGDGDPVGIAFNEELVVASTNAVADFSGNPDDMVNDHRIMTFIAVLEESLEHELELGHSKLHNEGMVDPDDAGKKDCAFKKNTPEKLRHEAGYATNQQIRADNFPNEARDNTCALIELNPKRKRNLFEGALNPYLVRLPESKKKEDPRLFSGSTTLTLEEIAQHMDYPKDPEQRGGTPCQSSGRPFSESNEDGGDDKDDDDDAGAGGPPDEPRRKRQKPDGPPPPPSGAGGGSGWLDRVASLLPDAVKNAKKATAKRLSKITETPCSGDEERLTHADLGVDEDDLMEQCDVNVKFCNKDRELQETFLSSEDVCVLLKVTNTSQKDVVVPITRETFFGRNGMKMEILGMKRGRVTPVRAFHLPLRPGEHYTFFRVLTKAAAKSKTGYGTPGEGVYKAKVGFFKSEFPGVFQFEVK